MNIELFTDIYFVGSVYGSGYEITLKDHGIILVCSIRFTILVPYAKVWFLRKNLYQYTVEEKSNVILVSKPMYPNDLQDKEPSQHNNTSTINQIMTFPLVLNFLDINTKLTTSLFNSDCFRHYSG